MQAAVITRHRSIGSFGAPRRLLVAAMGGQGARRKRNWRHNRPNSPYRSWKLCPQQQKEEARRQQQAREPQQQPGSARIGHGNQQADEADDGDC